MKEKEEERINKLKNVMKKIYMKKVQNIFVELTKQEEGLFAGPVVVGAVVMPRDSKLEFMNDSKKLRKKEEMYYMMR